MTVKFPLCAYLMEISAMLQMSHQDLELNWIPRDHNTEADELSSMGTRRFRDEHRVPVVLEEMKFVLLNELLDQGEKLYQSIEKTKDPTASPRPPMAKKRKRKPETRLRATHPW